MATCIKIYVADGHDRDSETDLTPEQMALLRNFLGQVSYGDIYRYVPATGTDGNKAGSQSDRETRTTQGALRELRRALDRAFPDHP